MNGRQRSSSNGARHACGLIDWHCLVCIGCVHESPPRAWRRCGYESERDSRFCLHCVSLRDNLQAKEKRERSRKDVMNSLTQAQHNALKPGGVQAHCLRRSVAEWRRTSPNASRNCRLCAPGDQGFKWHAKRQEELQIQFKRRPGFCFLAALAVRRCAMLGRRSHRHMRAPARSKGIAPQRTAITPHFCWGWRALHSEARDPAHHKARLHEKEFDQKEA